MVRSARSHREEEEHDDGDFFSRAFDVSSQKVKLDGMSNGQKAHAVRSKHSETEQRRRSKINERFQILRDLIPQNDQKRDKASFLLEVIQYIQFLQENLQIYEGTYQGWQPEPSKLMAWRNNCGSEESFFDQSHSQLERNDPLHVDANPPLLNNSQNPMESNLSGNAVYKVPDHPSGVVAQAIYPNMPLQPNLFNGLSAQPMRGSFSSPEHLAPESQSQIWQGRSCTIDHAIAGYNPDEQEELKADTRESSISYAYSQGLLNTLTNALQSSGVDLAHASISVQLDVGRQEKSGSTGAMFARKDHEDHSPSNQALAHHALGSENSNQHY
uniref:Transcription factor bHLH45 n=1 Tax=Nothapodytes nimmoniana TaxID=159386 RepID=A0A9E8Z0H0_NOTNI|nr:transcription factor bHLH45 [Nothapodytes nimmoniana]